MAFKGDLTNISLFDVFQTLSQNKQNGVLVLSRDGRTKKIHISPDGVRIFFTRSFRPLRLGEIFVRRGRITPQDVEILLLEQKKAYRPFGELLVAGGKVTQEEVDSVLRYHAEDEIFEVFGWEVGTFSFYDGQEAGDATTPLSDVIMDPAGLCLEAARRLDELERLRERIPTNNEYYVCVDGIEPDRLNSSEAACAVFDALAEPNSVDDLRDLVGLSLYDVLNVVNELVQAGLIRPLTVDELVGTAYHARDAGMYERAAQLFEKAHERNPGDREILQECADAIQRLDQPRRLAKFLATLGAICLEQGEVDEAIDYLEQTLRADATHLGAMLSLREGFLQQGDAERVAEISLKIARMHSEKGRLDEAIESCAVGLDRAPEAVSLRFYYAQLLARTDEVEAAREQIWALVQDAERSGRAATSDKAHELLASCYRLLLKIDPRDEEAEYGLRDLDRRRMTSLRRRKYTVRGGVAAALILVIVGIGFTVKSSSAGDRWDRIQRAQASRPNSPYVIDLIDGLVTEHPQSAEAQQALELRQRIVTFKSANEKARKEQRSLVRQQLNQEFEEVRAALSDKSYGDALDSVKRFLAKLDKPQVGFLRKDMSARLEWELGNYLERVTKRFDQDRQQVSIGEVQIKQYEGDIEQLAGLERKLASVRQRDWAEVLPRLVADLRTVGDSRHVNSKTKQAFAGFRQRVQGSQAVFANLDALFFKARSERLRAEIMDLVRVARTDGMDYLRLCEFEKARQVYNDAYEKAYGVEEEDRRYSLDLLNWLEVRRIPAQMRAQRDKIDLVVATLRDVENLRKEGQSAGAYRLMRDLVSSYRLIEFEEKYEMPYEVVSVPAGATVTVNGKPAGRTPCEITMEIGQKPVLVRLARPGFADTEARLVPTDPELDGRLKVELQKDLAWDKELTGSGVEAPPVIADGKVLLATTDASLLALDLKTGRRVWEAPTGLLHRVTARPAVSGDTAYLITVGGYLHQVRLKDGKILGRRELGAQVDRDPAVHNGVLYVATRKPSLVALRGTKILYEVPLAQSPTTRVLYLDGLLCVGTAKGSVLVHDAKTGKERHRFRAPSGTSFWGGLAKHKSLVLAGAEDGKLYAFDTKSLQRAWEFPTGAPLAAPAVSAGSFLYLPARDGYLHILSTEGKRDGVHDVGYAMKTEPALLDGFIYVLGSNRVKAFDLAARTPWWDRAFGSDEFPQYVATGEGFIIVVTEKPWVYAFPRDEQ